MSTDKIIFADRDRDKSYIGKFSEVINKVQMTTSDGSTVTIDLENIGQIQVKPWSSDDEPGALFGTAEDRTVFNPCNLHDVEILELMATHAREFRKIVDAEHAEQDKKNQPTAAATTKTLTDGKPHSDNGVPNLRSQQESFGLSAETDEDDPIFGTREEIRTAMQVMK